MQQKESCHQAVVEHTVRSGKVGTRWVGQEGLGQLLWIGCVVLYIV